MPPPDYLQGLRRICDSQRLAADAGRSAERHRPHRQMVRLPACRHHARRDDAGQGPRLAACRSAPAWRRARQPKYSSRAIMARLSAAIRWPAPQRWRRWKHRGTKTCWQQRREIGAVHPRRLAQAACRTCRRGRDPRRGLMIGIELDRPCGELVKRGARRGPADQRHRRQRGAPAAAAGHEARRSAAAGRHARAADQGFSGASEHDRAPPGRHLCRSNIFCNSRISPATSSSTCSSARAGSRSSSRPTSPTSRCIDRTLVMIFEKSQHAHPAVVRSRHAAARRLGDLPQHPRLPTGPRRTGGRRGAGDLAHERHRDDPHLRAGDHRALRRATRACR